MKKIIILIISVLILTSCGMTNQEKIKAMDFCKEAGYGHRETLGGEIRCSTHRLNEDTDIMDCVKEYTRGLDEKYNNPDTVVNLREDNYSNVVKMCNDIFGEKTKEIIIDN